MYTIYSIILIFFTFSGLLNNKLVEFPGIICKIKVGQIFSIFILFNY